MGDGDKSKKRKRTAEGEEGRSQRRLPPHAIIKVKHIAGTDSALGPIVAATPGIYAPEDITFTPYRKTVVSKTTGKKRSEMLLQSSQHGRLDYIAQEEQAGGPLGNLKHYVAVYDGLAGEFSITECHKVTLRSTLRPTQDELDEEMKQKERQTYGSQRIDLGQSFGTKKAKKVIADQTVNAITPRKTGESVSALEQAMIDDLNVKTEGMITAEEAQREVDASKPRPDPNMSAQTAGDVYPISNLVSNEDLALLQVQDWIKAAKAGENLKLPTRYAAYRMARVASLKDDEKLRLLKYVNTALTWYNKLESDRGKKRVPPKDKIAQLVDAPGAILASLRRQFAEGNSMTAWFKDKLILYVCAIALHIDNFEVDTNDLMQDLQLSAAEITKYFMELGCRVSGLTAAERDRRRLDSKQAVDHRMARLQLPLEFPKQRTGARQGRR